jgi:hypothetical protein
MAIDTKKISLPKAAKVADSVKIVNKEDGTYVIYPDGDLMKEQKITPGNLNKEEMKIIKRDGEVQVGIAEANQKSKANPGDAGGSIAKLAKGGFPDLSGDGEVTQKDILMGKGVIKMKKGGIVKKKSSRTRIAKRGFGIAKRGY